MLVELLIVLVLVSLFVYRTAKVPHGLPPGSLGLPVLGVFPSRKTSLTQHFINLKKKYGKIITTKWGNRLMVIIADYQLAKKALNHPDFHSKADFHATAILNHGHHNTGVLSSYGPIWAANRKFLLKHLKDLGMGSTVLEVSIQDEAKMLTDYFCDKNLNQPLAIDWGINVSVFNVIWMMVAGIRYEPSDKVIANLAEMYEKDIDLLQGPLIILDYLPFLIPFSKNFIVDWMFDTKKCENSRKLFRTMVHGIIDDHRKKLDKDNPHDIIDFYLLEVEKEKDNPDTIFKPDCINLVTLLGDMFVAGSETVSNSLRWTFLYMAAYPEIQRKVHEELDREVPNHRQPSLQDRPRLPYMEAMILDVQRMSTIVPNGSVHCTGADVSFEGYTIPKDTGLMVTLEAFHHDPAHWEKPNQLYPEHFLDSQGKLVSKREGFAPFSVGKRQCLGEPLARMELFLFTSALLQRFEVSPPAGVEMDMRTDPTKFILNQPKHIKLIFKKRT